MFFRNRETSALIIRKNTEKNTLTSGRNTLTSLFNKVARWTTWKHVTVLGQCFLECPENVYFWCPFSLVIMGIVSWNLLSVNSIVLY